MHKKLLAVLLIGGWVILSAIDLVEDLIEISGHVVVSSASAQDGSTGKFGGWGPLANNIVESATRTPSVHVSVGSYTAIEFDPASVSDFPRCYQLYKFYRVFLI
jgi:hypothetical protein